MEQRTILLIDDDASLLRVMEHHLTEAGYRVTAVADGVQGLDAHTEHPADAIFTDLKMPGLSGIEFITAVREFDTSTSIVVITGFPTVNSAVKAMKAGALDFIQKPVDRDHLLAIARKAVDVSHLRRENMRLRSLVDDHLDFGSMIGNAPAIRNVYHRGRQAARSGATVMITGETGTGKEVLAKAIHNSGNRNSNRFIAVNCASVPANLLESELFGHVRGSFTGAISDRKGMIEEAAGGTFFLDEIGDMPLELQPKLLRVLQEKTFQPVGSNTQKKTDARFIVATHRNLDEMVASGTFREDLFFRLNVIPIRLPSIRERREDIVPLFLHFFREAAETEEKPVPDINDAVFPKLESYDWPGNVREIQNIASRIIALHTGTTLTVSDLPEPFSSLPVVSDQTIQLPETGIDLEKWIDSVVIAALEKNNWNQTRTASFLNISRNTLVYRLDKRKLKPAAD
jgi:DNA-binding NtrC family response regulator